MPNPLRYADAGVLSGKTPYEVFIRVHHLKRGPSRFKIEWAGEMLTWAQADRVRDELGITVPTKQSGDQQGYPNVAVLGAVWHWFVDRYNEAPKFEPLPK